MAVIEDIVSSIMKKMSAGGGGSGGGFGVKDLTSSIMGRLQSNPQGVQDASKGVAAAQESLKETLEGVKDAQEKLKDAVDNVGKLQTASQDAALGVTAAQAKLQQAVAAVPQSQAKLQQAGVDVTKASEEVKKAQQKLQQVTAAGGDIASAQLEVQDKQAKLATASANVPAAQANLDSAKLGVPEAQAKILAAQQKLQDTQAKLTAAQAGVPTAQADLATAQSGVPTAQAGVTTAQQKLAAAQAGGSENILGNLSGAAKESGMGDSGIGKSLKMAELAARAAEGDPIAIMGLVKEVVNQTKEKMVEVGASGKEVGAAVQSERFGDVGAHMFGATEHMGKAIGGPVGGAIEQVSKFGKAIMEGVEKLRKWNDQLMASNFQFAEFSGAMASVAARQEVRDIQLSKERGDRRAESAEHLAAGRQSMEKAMAPIEDVWAKGKNEIMAIVDRGIAQLLTTEPVQVFIKMAEQVIAWLPKVKGDPQGDLDKWLKEPWTEKHGQPDRFRQFPNRRDI